MCSARTSPVSVFLETFVENVLVVPKVAVFGENVPLAPKVVVFV